MTIFTDRATLILEDCPKILQEDEDSGSIFEDFQLARSDSRHDVWTPPVSRLWTQSVYSWLCYVLNKKWVILNVNRAKHVVETQNFLRLCQISVKILLQTFVEFEMQE